MAFFSVLVMKGLLERAVVQSYEFSWLLGAYLWKLWKSNANESLKLKNIKVSVTFEILIQLCFKLFHLKGDPNP